MKLTRYGLIVGKKILLSVALASVLAAGSIIAAPLAAQAATPSTFELPTYCDFSSVSLKTLKQDAAEGYDAYDLRSANVHPTSGNEYVFTTYCKSTSTGFSDVLIVANSKGKIIKDKQFKNRAIDVVSASSTGGIKVKVDTEYRVSSWNSTTYVGAGTMKWSTSGKKWVYNNAATPTWVKDVDKAVVSAAKGQYLAGLTGSQTGRAKFKAKVLGLDSEYSLSTWCAEYSTTRTTCATERYDAYPTVRFFEFDFKKSGSKHYITRVGKYQKTDYSL